MISLENFIDILNDQLEEESIEIEISDKDYTLSSRYIKRTYPNIFLKQNNYNSTLENELTVRQQIDGSEIDTPFFFFDKNNKIDLIGNMIFILEGYHYKNHGYDSFGRFDFKSTPYYRKGLFHRMLYEEYLYFLCNELKIKYPKQKVSITLTCDIDRPLSRINSINGLLKSLLADIVLRKSIGLFFRRILSNILPLRVGGFFFDPFNTYEYIIGLKKRFRLKEIIFFLLIETPKNKKNKIDKTLNVQSEGYQSILKILDQEDIKLGLHPSFSSSKTNIEQIREESYLYKKLEVGNNYSISRAHYLIYNEDYLQKLTALNYTDDYSLGSEYFIGFTNGTSRPIKRQVGKRIITLHNLTFMDVVYFKDKKKYTKDLDLILNEIRLWGGNFILLWHNNYLQTNKEKKELEKILNKAACVE